MAASSSPHAAVAGAARGRRGRRAAVLSVLAIGAFTCTTVALNLANSLPRALPGSAFVGGATPTLRPRVLRSTVFAEGEAPAPAPAPSSVALVKVNDENMMTSAGVLGGLAGLLVGGVWVGGALFLASSYLARREGDDDVAKGLKGLASGGLEAINFGGYVNDKYEITNKVGGAFGDALESAKSKSETQGVASSVADFAEGVGETISTFDKDVGIKDTIGSVLMSGTELAAQAVQKGLSLNDDYKVTDQIKEKIDEVLSKTKPSP